LKPVRGAVTIWPIFDRLSMPENEAEGQSEM
jgi:hypothetical protein